MTPRPQKIILLLLLALYCCRPLVRGQEAADWEEQVLGQVDADDLGEEAYAALMEELSDLTVWSDTTQMPLLGRLRQHLIWSSNRCLNQRAGFKEQITERQEANKAYLGDPWHHSLRYRAQMGQRWQMGFNVEKDAGEAWRSEWPLFDSWHAFVRLRQLPLGGKRLPYFGQKTSLMLNDAVLGHYRLKVGCGLVLSQGFSLGKQYFAQQLLQQRSNTISPFASNAESGYMQGAAASLQYALADRQSLTLLPYFSARQIDGTLSSQHTLTAIQTDGMHRTKTEASHRQVAWQWILGTRLGWRGEWFDVGLHASYTHLQYDYKRQLLYYNQNYFRGHQLFQSALDYTIHAFGGWLRGEVALDDQDNVAALTSLQFSVSDSWHMALLHRYYSPQYRQLHASALRESSAMQGEQGMTLNTTWQFTSHWQLQSMIDGFWFNQPQYGVRDSISAGYEGLLRIGYENLTASHPHNLKVSLTYRLKHKAETYRHGLDGIVSLSPHPALSCKTQLRARLFNKKEGATISTGYAAAQSVNYHGRAGTHFQFTLDAQACYFRTDDYDARLYLTEQTVLYGFGLPMLYGEGVRYSFTSTIKIGPRLNVDLKYALTNYANRNTIGSGLQQINGNTQQDIWLQLRLGL